MNPLVAEFRALSATAPGTPARQVEILKSLDDDANEADVSALLLDLLRERSATLDAARAEAVEVVGLYIDEGSPQWRELFAEVLRIHRDPGERAAVLQAAEPYAAFLQQTLEG